MTNKCERMVKRGYMDIEMNMECAGNLFEELSELSKIILDSDSVETQSTFTAVCSAFLTVICC